MLDFLYLKYFCDAVKLGGITAAAKANFVTQSAVSQGISKLEGLLGYPLLARHPNRFRLTPAGEKAFQEMSELLKRTQSMQENLAGIGSALIGGLEFACTFSFALSLLPSYLREFQRAHPSVKINVKLSGNYDEIRQLLTVGVIDFAILKKPPDFSGFDEIPLFESEFGLFCSPDYDVKNHAFILAEPEETLPFKEAYFRKYKKEPAVLLEARSWIVAAKFAEEGLGIGYFPEYITHGREKFLIRCEKALKLPSFQMSAVYLKGMRLRKSSEIFLSLLTSSMPDARNGVFDFHAESKRK
ncbi:MAG: LysR family transcriptional regulator [Verrucomicrobia bacterium]|nr:LysR family transcriptional regulator [Verrucomicrobiota bacterium]